MNIFLRELKANSKALIIWCLAAVLFIAAGLSKYSVLSASEQSANEIMSKMPKAVQAFAGGTFNLSEIGGFYGITFTYLLLMALIHAVLTGSGVIAKEERDKTAEFLMTKPVSRAKILALKLASVFVQAVIFNLILFISSVLLIKQFEPESSLGGRVFLLMCGMLLVQIMFISIGVFLSAVFKNPSKAPVVAVGILLATYILSVVMDITENMQWLKYFTPFKYIDTAGIITGGSPQGVFIVIPLAVSAVLITASFVFYTKRDTHI